MLISLLSFSLVSSFFYILFLFPLFFCVCRPLVYTESHFRDTQFDFSALLDCQLLLFPLLLSRPLLYTASPFRDTQFLFSALLGCQQTHVPFILLVYLHPLNCLDWNLNVYHHSVVDGGSVFTGRDGKFITPSIISSSSQDDQHLSPRHFQELQ